MITTSPCSAPPIRAAEIVDPELRFSVLGPLEIVRGDLTIDLTASRVRGVLSALVLRAGTAVPRDQLIADLWGDEAPASAVATLHTYIAQLRRLLGGPSTGSGASAVIERRPSGYRLLAPRSSIDAHRFERGVRAGRELLAAARTVEAVDELQRATALWRGRPYADLSMSLDGAAEATRLERVWLDAVETRLRAELSLGRAEELVGDLEVLVARHPLRESLWSLLMVALYRSGRQADALDAYRRLRGHLVEALGIEPNGELRALELAVLRHDPALDLKPHRIAAPMAAPASTPVPTPTPVSDRPIERTFLVGRDTELTLLRHEWAQATAGRLRITWVDGEPGVGRSLLVDALVHEIDAPPDDAVRVVSAVCHPDLHPRSRDGHRVLAALVRALAQGSCADELRRWAGPFTGVLAALVPDLAALFDPASMAATSVLDQASEATAHLVRQAAANTPVLLVIEDVHHATPAVAAWVHQLSAAPDVPAHVVLTARATHLDASGRRAWAGLNRAGELRSLHLAGLSQRGVYDLWRHRGGPALDAEERAALHVATGGNPSLVVALTNAEGAVGSALPTTAREHAAERLLLLRRTAIETVTLAATLPQPFHYRHLASLAGLADRTAIDIIEQLIAAGILDEVHGAEGSLRFRHDLVRRAIVANLSATRRAYLRDLVSAGRGEASGVGTPKAHHRLVRVR